MLFKLVHYSKFVIKMNFMVWLTSYNQNKFPHSVNHLFFPLFLFVNFLPATRVVESRDFFEARLRLHCLSSLRGASKCNSIFW